jgi:hypothetical protein
MFFVPFVVKDRPKDTKGNELDSLLVESTRAAIEAEAPISDLLISPNKSRGLMKTK